MLRHRGSRPGDVFGDVLFNFLVAKIDRSIEEVVQNLGLGCMVPYSGIRTFEQQPLELMSDSAPLPKVSFVDDLAIPVVSKRVAEHIERTAAAATAGIDAPAKHGLSCKFDAGKSECMIAFHGAGSQAAEKALWVTQTPQVRLDTQSCGAIALLVLLTLGRSRARQGVHGC